MKRLFFLVLVCVVLIIFAIFTVSSLAETNADKSKVEIWVPGGNGQWIISSDLPARFEAAYPQYELEFSQYSWKSVHDKLVVGFAGGDLPDCAMITDQSVGEFAALGVLEPMEDFKKANNYDDADFTPNAWSHFITQDSILHAAPTYNEVRVLFYRTDLFKEAGISHPPTTLDELIEFGIKLTNGEDKFGLADQKGSLDFHFFSWILYAKGGNFYTPDHTKCALNEPAGIEALKFYKSLYDKDIIPKDPAKQAEPFNGFIQGYYAMAESGPWWLALLADQPEMEGKWAIAVIPGDKTRLTYGHPNPWVIPAEAKNKDGAKAWIKFCTTAEIQSEVFKGYGSLPILLAAYDDPALKNDPDVQVFLEGAMHGSDSLHNIPNASPILILVSDMLNDLKTGKVTPEEGAAAACNMINNLLNE